MWMRPPDVQLLVVRVVKAPAARIMALYGHCQRQTCHVYRYT